MQKLSKGTKIYYTGDMANDSYQGEITDIEDTDWGKFFIILKEDGQIARVTESSLTTDKSRPGKRFFTLKAWYEKQKEQKSEYPELVKQYNQKIQALA